MFSNSQNRALTTVPVASSIASSVVEYLKSCLFLLRQSALYRNGTLHNNRHFCTKIKPPSVKCRQGLAN